MNLKFVDLHPKVEEPAPSFLSTDFLRCLYGLIRLKWSHSLALTFTLMGDYLQYRPRTLDTLHYHQGLSERLKSLVCCKSIWIRVFDIFVGCFWRLSTYVVLWTFWGRQENAHKLHFETVIWAWSRKGMEFRTLRSNNNDAFSSSKSIKECFCLLQNENWR